MSGRSLFIIYKRYSLVAGGLELPFDSLVELSVVPDGFLLQREVRQGEPADRRIDLAAIAVRVARYAFVALVAAYANRHVVFQPEPADRH